MRKSIKARISSETVLPAPGGVKVFIDDQLQTIFGDAIGSDGTNRTYFVTRSCNLAEGVHTLKVLYTVNGVNGQPQTYDERNTFEVTDNRWPGIIKNGAFGCETPNGPVGATPTVVYTKNNPTEGPISLFLGETARQTRYANKVTRYEVDFSGTDLLVVNWVFKAPFDGDPRWYGYFSNIAHWLDCGTPADFDPEGKNLPPAGGGSGPSTERAPILVRPQSLPTTTLKPKPAG